uniref:Uncharacterized protein n=1 Tax=Glossina austeni TaxID=7395 RepID=A0A1A9VNS9_GLOAU
MRIYPINQELKVFYNPYIIVFIITRSMFLIQEFLFYFKINNKQITEQSKAEDEKYHLLRLADNNHDLHTKTIKKKKKKTQTEGKAVNNFQEKCLQFLYYHFASFLHH